MRVAIIVPVWDDPTLPRVVKDLRATLDGRCDFFAIARRRAAQPSRMRDDGVEVFHVGWFSRRAPRWLQDAANLVLVPWQTASVLRRHPHDLVHYQFSGGDWNLVAVSSFFFDKPLLVTLQGFLRGFSRWWMAPLFSRLVRRASALSAVSDDARLTVCARFPNARGKIVTIHNGVDAEFFARAPAARRRRPYILSVARLAAYKGLDLLAFAFLDLLREGRDLDLVVCGPEDDDGHVRGLLRRLGLEDRVQLLGTLARADVARLLRGCEFMALPSRRGEGFSLAVLEALAAGRTVIATGVAGNLECLEHERNALLVAALDVPALAGAMRRLLDDPVLRARLEDGARGTAARFDRRLIGDAYREWYAKAA